LLLTYGARSLINTYLIQTVFFDARITLLGLLFGAMLGLVGSAVSVGRHLRRI
jgi:cell division transport system permease protein